jgi:predicted transcriptional regulator
MGLIGWVKRKYYDSRLDKADNLVLENDLAKAEEIYRDLLGKQDEALSHLAEMFVAHSDDAEAKISALKSIESLREYVNEDNETDYNSSLNTHVENIEQLAKQMFRAKQYGTAVSLSQSISAYRRNDNTYALDCHRYKAYHNYFLSAHNSSRLKDVVSELKLYLPTSTEDIKYFAGDLESSKKYSRAISLMLPFVKDSKDFNAQIVTDIVAAVRDDDFDLKNINHLSAVCEDANLCKDAAIILVKQSAEAAKSKDYKRSVRLDTLVSEYFSDDNTFNNGRCVHALEELATRAEAKEVKQLMNLARTLKLNDDQIASLKKRIAIIAKTADSVKGIAICRLFLSEKTFDLLYIKQAKKLVESNPKVIDSGELLTVIKRNSDADTYPDVLSDFVNALPYDNEFFESAVAKIKNENNPSLLKKYWTVKESPIFFKELVNASFDGYKEIVTYVSDNAKLFLHTKALRDAFCKALDSIKDIDYSLASAESLIKKGCDVDKYYVTVALKYTDGKSASYQVESLNHALTVLKDQQLIDKFKKAIRVLIQERDFERAEQEAKFLSGLDEESDTLLAEIHFAKAQSVPTKIEKKDQLYLVLDVVERGQVYTTFDQNKNRSLSQLVDLAVSFQNDGDNETAYQIAERLLPYHTTWIELYIKLRNVEYRQVQLLSEKIKFQQYTINAIGRAFNKASALRSITRQDYYDQWTELKTLTVEKSVSQPKDKAVSSLSALRDQVSKYCNEAYSKPQVDDLTKRILKLKWALATETEADLNYDNAISYYDSVKEEAVSSYVERSEIRSLICYIKAGKVDRNVEERIQKALNYRSHQTLKDDLAYRYACYLLKATRPTDAEKIIRNYLPDESQLLQLCKNIYIKESEKYLSEFNQKVKTMAEGKMSTDDAITFRSEIDRYKRVVSNNLKDTTSKFDAYKSIVESYILKSLFKDERYEAALDKMIDMYPDFIDDDQQLRNVAIAALGYVESGSAKGKKLEFAISLWLSAVYTDRLFVKSLDYTSWDDPYTFTLSESLGKTTDSDYDELPENINFDEPVDNENISIKDVQTSLVSRMETTIRDNYPDEETFFNSEKSALDGLLELNLDEDFIVAAPKVATKLQEVSDSIKEALDYELDQDYGNTEDVLRTGLSYGYTSGKFSSYKNACQLAERCKQSLSATTYQVKTAFNALPQIKEYSKLYDELRSFVSNKMKEAIKSKMLYTTFMDTYEPVCKAFDESQLSFAFSNYANGEVIHRLNDDSMKERDGLGYLVRIYKVAPSSVQVKQNVVGVLKYLVREVAEHGYSADRSALNSALSNLGTEFKKIAEEEEIQYKLGDIIDKVNGGNMARDKALKQVYDLYCQLPNNDRLCENLVTLCDMCIMEFVVGDKSGSYAVCRVLDALKNNKSAAFNRHKGKLAQTYMQIWNQLSPENQMLMMGLGGFGTTLNEKGEALKRGLNYYKELGDVRTPRGFGGLGRRSSLFDDYPF